MKALFRPKKISGANIQALLRKSLYYCAYSQGRTILSAKNFAGLIFMYRKKRKIKGWYDKGVILQYVTNV